MPYCSNCKCNVYAEKVNTNHVVNFILTILTGGLWIIPWLIFTITQSFTKCGQCGKILGP